MRRLYHYRWSLLGAPASSPASIRPLDHRSALSKSRRGRRRSQEQFADIASKRDIKDLEVKLAETKADLIRWIVGVGLLQITLITALLLKLIH
jgi:ribosomal protein L32